MHFRVWFHKQPITVRAAIIGAILAGVFSVIVAVLPLLLNTAYNRPKIIASIMDFGRINRYTRNGIETIDCESTIRLHNIGETAITLDHVEASSHIGNKSFPTIWQNEYVGSANSVDGIVYYFEITGDLSPISISPHSALDVKMIFSVQGDINEYQFIENLNDLDVSKYDSRKITVSYKYIFPDQSSATTKELFCVYAIAK